MLSHPWISGLDLRQLHTPLDRCIGVWPGKVDRAVVEDLRRHRFDQAPVLGSPAGAIGVVSTEDLERLLESGELLHDGHELISRQTIPPESSLDAVLTAMSETRGRLVVSGARVQGLITISDLNRHPFRVALYAPFAALEEMLALTIERECPDLGAWLGSLPEEDQIRILGSWEVSKRFSVDTGPLTGCTLTQLIRIVAVSPKVRAAAGFSAAGEAQAELGRLPTYRNRVMHPVRPLVLAPLDVARLKDTVDLLGELLARLNRGS